MSALETPGKNSGGGKEVGFFVLFSFSFTVNLQLMGPVPSWHPGGSGSPVSLWEKNGGEREGWEWRKEEGMNQNTIKGTGWPFWELKACWLQADSGRCTKTSRERDGDSEMMRKKRPGRPFIHWQREISPQPFNIHIQPWFGFSIIQQQWWLNTQSW